MCANAHHRGIYLVNLVHRRLTHVPAMKINDFTDFTFGFDGSCLDDEVGGQSPCVATQLGI